MQCIVANWLRCEHDQTMMFQSLRYGLALLLITVSPAAVAQTFVQDGDPVARIYIAKPTAASGDGDRSPAEPSLMLAIQELNYHFMEMSGASLEVVELDDPAAIEGSAIILGDLAARLGVEPIGESVSGEAYRLLSRDDRLLIAGESDQAVLFGVYTLLEKLGCDWVMPGPIGEIIPKRRTIAIDPIDISQTPDFSMRQLWYRGGASIVTPEEKSRFQQWLRRNRSGDYIPAAQQTRGHYWNFFIKKHQDEFDRDPTMYALRPDSSGVLQRRGPQIESTHPRVSALMAQDIRDMFAKRGLEKDAVAGFPIGPADGLGFSQSPEAIAAGSERFDTNSGVADQTDHLVLLANRVFADLGDEYPNVLLGFYSYGAHSGYPVRYTPHPRLVQIFAPIDFSRYHSVVDDRSRTQGEYRETVEQWAELSRAQGNPLIFRGYNWNLAENMLPYTKVRIWGEELPFYKRMGIRGLSVEATKAWGINGPSDWLFMQLAWDSSQNWRVLLSEYCRKSFGAGASHMESYFLRLVERQHSAGQEAGSYHAIPLIFDRDFVMTARRDVEEAIRLADTPERKARAQHFLGGIRALEIYLDYHEAATQFDFLAAKRSFDEMFENWQQTYTQNTDLVAREGPEYLDRFIRPFIDGAVKFTSAPFALVSPLPDEIPTIFASLEEGLQRGYHRTDLSGDGTPFAPTRTFSTTWDDQRLTDRGGSVWYRLDFELPASTPDAPLFLFLGSFDDRATVWVNGERAGTTKAAFSKPAMFDLTGMIDREGKNMMAIHVERSRGISEIGIGGLFRPSFLFTGPSEGVDLPLNR